MDVNKLLGVGVKAVIVADTRRVGAPLSNYGLKAKMREKGERVRQRFSVYQQVEIHLSGRGLGQINVTLPMAVNNLGPVERVYETIY
jgi:hypothetical protein